MELRPENIVSAAESHSLGLVWGVYSMEVLKAAAALRWVRWTAQVEIALNVK
jgi:hypothetical protein